MERKVVLNQKDNNPSFLGFVLLIFESFILIVLDFIGAGYLFNRSLHIPIWAGGCFFLLLFIAVSIISVILLTGDSLDK